MMPPVLKVDSVQLSFGGRVILRSIWLECMRGEVVGLLGRNGSGKSCLLRIIFGAMEPGYKYVSINDKFIGNGYAKGRIAYLPQHNYLPHGVKIGKLAKMLVEPMFWDDFTQQDIYKAHHDKTAGQLSGGELRMLETLMIIYNKADFILLDEPFTHISPVQVEFLKPIIKACAKQKGIIITDHQYYNVLDISDRLIVLENGCTKPVKDADDLVTYKYLSGIH
jgi:lipopolysaccharide export system ATP-binding protein